MKQTLIALALFSLAAAPMDAQQGAPGSPDVVAVVNGETITRTQLDQLWNRLSEKARTQYDKNGGGKRGFLDNYIRKRLLLQQAAAANFQKSATVQAELEAAKESALFDMYVRDVIASSVVNESTIRKFYEDHAEDFMRPEQAKVRMILITTANRSQSDARGLAGRALQELSSARAAAGNDAAKVADAFARLAQQYSDHPSAAAGGNLGWVSREAVDAHVATAAFSVRPGTFSGILEAEDGMHLILVEAKRPAAKEPFESARAGIREYLLSSNAQKIVEAISNATADLQKSAKVTVYADNVE
ncbi:MAG TPA: peptidyl-prolyl cis-trans isomerase [Thermoanaerobaculia bacterium]|nr:peptidyl-prolyl cis-trans isomerase [Thermoanaerobaculia bacterium]